MFIRRLRLVGFQSFADTGEIEFGPGINLIIGPNNVGKSALLRSLTTDLPNDPHRTPERFERHRLRIPKQELTLSFGLGEVEDAILRRERALIPVPSGHIHLDTAFIKGLVTSECDITFERDANGNLTAEYPSHRRFVSGPDRFALRALSQDGQLAFGNAFEQGDDLPQLGLAALKQYVFYISAQRLSLGESQSQHVALLSPDASNLPAVLDTLIGSRGSVYLRLVEYLRQIFPTVGNLSVRPHPNSVGRVQVLVWPTKEMEEAALAFPLQESGTGVAQVIAILTAVATAKKSVMVIDEINSFLHPAAVKRF